MELNYISSIRCDIIHFAEQWRLEVGTYFILRTIGSEFVLVTSHHSVGSNVVFVTFGAVASRTLYLLHHIGMLVQTFYL